jgi:hypothetical protein
MYVAQTGRSIFTRCKETLHYFKSNNNTQVYVQRVLDSLREKLKFNKKEQYINTAKEICIYIETVNNSQLNYKHIVTSKKC